VAPFRVVCRGRGIDHGLWHYHRPPLLFLALDVVIGLLIIRSCMERRAGFSVALATAARSGIPEGGR
jgi:hypothetical protein